MREIAISRPKRVQIVTLWSELERRVVKGPVVVQRNNFDARHGLNTLINSAQDLRGTETPTGTYLGLTLQTKAFSVHGWAGVVMQSINW